MADVLEQMRIWRCRIQRRRWLGLAVAWATCALGWTVFGLLPAARWPAIAGFALSLVLLVGIAAGAATAALIAGREPVFDSAAQLERSFGRPVLGSVADITSGSSTPATPDLCFAAAWVGLIAVFAALVSLQTFALAAR
jgi:hypothetical protein